MDPKEAERISDNLADIIWWFKGYNAAKPPESDNDIGSHHIESLRRVRVLLLDTVIKPNKE